MAFRPSTNEPTDHPLCTLCGRLPAEKYWRWTGNAPNGAAPRCPTPTRTAASAANGPRQATRRRSDRAPVNDRRQRSFVALLGDNLTSCLALSAGASRWGAATTSTTLPGPDATFDPPLEPAYPLGTAGSPITLFEGEIGGLAASANAGRIELSLAPKPSLNWTVELANDFWPLADNVDLRLRINGADWTIAAYQQDNGFGWINSAEFGAPGTQLDRVVVHWMNLPSTLGLLPLTFRRNDRITHYAGRWHADIEEWSITIDELPDRVAARAQATPLYAVTHVMQITKTDGSSFSVDAVEALIECLRVGLSFANGRWVAPAIPVGFDAAGARAWVSWKSPICDPPSGRDDGWLAKARPVDLTEYLTKALASFNNGARDDITRFQMLFGVEAAGGGTFVEHRLISAFSAIENLEWVSLVLSGRVTDSDYRRWPGPKRLRTVLDAAGVPLGIDAASLPSLANFAQTEGLVDGPAAVVEVRNRLVHPKRLKDDVYHIDGLAADAWLLARHYMTLLILHSIEYNGSHQRMLPPFGWAGEVLPVPWAPATNP